MKVSAEMKLVLLFVNLLLLRVKCAKILGVFPAPGYSQFILAEALMKEVANRGHEVTVISPYSPENEPTNYRTIKTDDIIGKIGEFDLFPLENEGLFKSIMYTYQFGNSITEFTLENEKVQELLHSNVEFDLVIVEQFFNDAMKGFAAHFKAPLVLFSSMGLTEWNKEYMGHLSLPTLNAVSYTSFTNQMTFFQRIKNVGGTIFDYMYRKFVVYPTQDAYLKKYFPNSINFQEIVNNATLMLLNSHVTTSENALLPYNMIEIGGFHVNQKPLSMEMQELLDKATDGAILFSLGSNLRSSDLSDETLNDIFKVFAKLKQTILWKFEKDSPNKPANVHMSKWLNQSDILGHPNIQLFITHGGILSTIEAVFYGVPMVGIPVFADQKMNMARASSMGIANVVSLRKLSEQTLSSAINEVITNPKFQQNARSISNLMRDRVIRPLDLAVYWIEYVLRHRGFRFEAPASKLYWFEVYMIDMFFFILLVILIMFVMLKCIFKMLKVNTCSNRKSNNKRKQQ